jgi:hypothetical protein
MEQEISELREALTKERKAVADFLIPWKRHLDQSWLDHFVRSGIVYFNEIGYVLPVPVEDKEGK